MGDMPPFFPKGTQKGKIEKAKDLHKNYGKFKAGTTLFTYEAGTLAQHIEDEKLRKPSA